MDVRHNSQPDCDESQENNRADNLLDANVNRRQFLAGGGAIAASALLPGLPFTSKNLPDNSVAIGAPPRSAGPNPYAWRSTFLYLSATKGGKLYR